MLGPPAEAIGGLPLHRVLEALDPQPHIHPQHIAISEEIKAARPPQPEVAGKPAPQAAVQLDAADGLGLARGPLGNVERGGGSQTRSGEFGRAVLHG
ncbi:MAG: hypothetical protein ACK56I_12600, partial [bacterium]